MQSLRSSMEQKPIASPIRVLQVGDFPPPTGGVATHVEELFHAVRASGGECEVLDIGKGQLPADGVHAAGSMPSFAAQLATKVAGGFRIHLHTNGANPKSWLLAQVCAAAGRLSGGAIVTLHSGLGPGWLAERPARRVLAKTILSQFSAVIAVSRQIRDALGACGVRDALVLPAFSPASVKPGAPPAGLRELRATSSPLFCAMVAPRAEYGQELLMTAFAEVRRKLPRAALALYGPGSEAVHADGVHGFGELPRPQALALMAACDVFARPTLADGDSVSVREALALGRAVVASDVGTRPPEVLLVRPADPGAMARGLLAAGSNAARFRAPPVAGEAGSCSGDSISRILSLYGLTEDRCAASAVS
jgi:glycosyltransferase involved in cell wall biosynthesis